MFKLISLAPAMKDEELDDDRATRAMWDELRTQAISPSDREEIDAIFSRNSA